MEAPLIAAVVVTAAFVALSFEATIAVRRQEQIEHYRRLLARADRVRTYRLALSKVQTAHRKANSFHAVQQLVGDDSAATKLARDTYLEAAWDAPTADTATTAPKGSLR